MGTASETSPVKVYATSRWPPRALGASFFVIGLVGFLASGVALPLIVFGGMAAVILFAGERMEVQVSPQGVTSIPPLGRSRSFPWSDIDTFVAQRIAGGYGAWVIAMKVSDQWVELTATRRGGFSRRSRGAAQELADELNAELARAGEKPPE